MYVLYISYRYIFTAAESDARMTSQAPQSYIYFTILKDDIPRLHHALGLDALGGSVRLENGMEFGTEEALLIHLLNPYYYLSATILRTVFF